MKKYRTARVSILIIGFAISSPIVLAQVAPAPELPSADTAPAGSSSKTLYPRPIPAYTPPTEREKLRHFAFDAFGPYAFAEAAVAGGYQEATNSPPDWGSGWNAFGERVANKFGIQLVTATTRYGMAEIFHEDAAYYRCECRGFFPRFSHALISTLTGRRGKDGHTVFSFPGLVSPYAGTMAALAWYPNRFGVKDGFRMGNYNLAAQAGGNLALEFIYGGPRTLFKRLGRSKLPSGAAAAQNP
jgi:hypothetical protein